jgi:hypothetical protein
MSVSYEFNSRFPSLMREIECINYAWGWPGMLDSLEYIGNRISEYEDTQVGIEYFQFISEMRKLFTENPTDTVVA